MQTVNKPVRRRALNRWKAEQEHLQYGQKVVDTGAMSKSYVITHVQEAKPITQITVKKSRKKKTSS